MFCARHRPTVSPSRFTMHKTLFFLFAVLSLRNFRSCRARRQGAKRKEGIALRRYLDPNFLSGGINPPGALPVEKGKITKRTQLDPSRAQVRSGFPQKVFNTESRTALQTGNPPPTAFPKPTASQSAKIGAICGQPGLSRPTSSIPARSRAGSHWLARAPNPPRPPCGRWSCGWV